MYGKVIETNCETKGTEMKLRMRQGAIEQIRRERNLSTEGQVAAVLGVTKNEVEEMRRGHEVSPAMALRVATIQGTGFDLSEWVETIDDSEAVS